MLKNQQRPINRRGDKSLLYIRTSTCHTVTWRDIITCHSLCCPAWVQIQARLSVLAELLMYSVSLTLVLQYSSFLLNYWCCGPLDVVACVPHVSRNGIIGAGFPLYHSVVSMQHRRPSTASLSFRCKLSHTHTHKGSGMQQFPSILQELLGLWRGSWGPSISSGWWRTWT